MRCFVSCLFILVTLVATHGLALSALPGDLKWSGSVGIGTEASPTVGSDGTIYIGGIDGILYAVNPDGTEKWTFVTDGVFSSSPAIAADGTIYVGNYDDRKLYAINPDGTEKWTYAGAGGFSSPAIAEDGTIYVGSDAPFLYAINPNGTLKWTFQTGDWIVSSPAIGEDGTVYFGSYDSNVYAVNPDGSSKWVFPTLDWVDSSPAIGTDGTIYIGSDDSKVYALNPDGTEKWAFATGGWVISSPAIGTDGTIYVGSDDKNLYAINPDGTQKWAFTTTQPIETSPAVGLDGTIYVGINNGILYAVNPDGSQKWMYSTGAWFDYSSPAVNTDGTVYIASSQLYAFYGNSGGLATSSWPMFGRTLSRDARLFLEVLAVTAPVGGELFTSGTVETLTWTAPANADHFRLHYFDADGTAHLVANVSGATSYDWTVANVSALESGKTLRVAAFDAADTYLGVDYTDGSFSIQPGATPLAITFPNDGQTLTGGAIAALTWTAPPGADHFRLHYFDADGTAHLVANVSSGTSFNWIVPNVAALETGKALRVTAFDAGNAVLDVDYSDSTFSIEQGAAPLTLTSPNGGQTLTSGTLETITWTAPPAADHFRLHYFDADGTAHLIANVSSGNSYDWTVATVNVLETGKKVRVTAFDVANVLLGIDYSDTAFSIAPGAAPLTLTSPNGGQTLTSGIVETITWTAPAGTDHFRLHYFDADGTAHLIANVSSGTSYDWTVPTVTVLESGKKVRITSFDAANAVLDTDFSDGTFAIDVP